MKSTAARIGCMALGLAWLGGCGAPDGSDHASETLPGDQAQLEQGVVPSEGLESWVIFNNGPYPAGAKTLVVDVYQGSKQNNARVQAFPYRPNGNGGIFNQYWLFFVNPYFPSNTGYPYYQIVNVNSQKCLDRFRSGNGSQVTQFTCDYRNPSQAWRFQPTTIMANTWLENRFGGCMHSDTLTSGAILRVRTCGSGSSSSQNWGWRRRPW
jgi:hypothetical protein